MVQQIISTGTSANDGTGEPLRTAFTKINQNFTEIYGRDAAGSNFDFTDNTLATINTNGNIEFDPNGTGIVVVRDNKLMIANSQTPGSTLGSAGDKAGMLAWDTNYLYICTANYDGVTNIWKKTGVAVGASSGSAVQLVNGNSFVNVAANANVTVSVAGNANIFKVTGTGANVSGTFQVSGNVNVGNVGTTTLITTGTANLNNIANVKIAGGSAGEAIITDGAGNLSFTAFSSNTLINGSTNLSVNSGDITFSVNGTPSLVYMSPSEVDVNGNLLVTGDHHAIDGNLTFVGTGRRIYGDFSNATSLSRVTVQSNVLNGNTLLSIIPNGVSAISRVVVYNNSNPANGSTGALAANSSMIMLRSTASGAGSFLPLVFMTGSNPDERMRVDVNGNVGIGNTLPTHLLSVEGTGRFVGTVTVGNLTTSGNVTAGNLITTGNLTIGNVAINNTTISTVNTNQDLTLDPNGTGNVMISGNANISGTANVVGNANVGNLGTTTVIATTANLTTINSGLLQNGNSNVTITANANVTITSKSNATLVITNTGANISGTANITGNANVGNLGTATVIATTANLTTINSGLLQNGSSNVTLGASGNVNIAVGSNVLTVTSTGAKITGTINSTGNANVNNIGTGNISATGNATISNVDITDATISTLNTNQNLTLDPNGTGNVNVTGNLVATGNISSARVLANSVTITGSAPRIYGDFSNVTSTGRVFIQSNVLNGNSNVGILPNGTSTIARLNVYNSSDPANSEALQLAANSSLMMIRSVITGTGTYNPLTLWTSDTERLRIAVDGNVTVARSMSISNINLSNATITTLNTNQNLTLDPNGTGLVAVTGDLTVSGNLTINGTTTTVNTTNLDVTDLNITVANGAASASAANGAGITVNGANASLTYEYPGNVWVFDRSANVTGTLTASNVNAAILQNGNSNISITSNANVTINSNSNATVVITGTGANISGTANISGNANVGNIGTATAIITTGNITTINSGLLQNGNSNVAITANGNVTITSSSNATLVITDTGANISGTINITGNANVGNIGATNVVTTGNIELASGKRLFGDFSNASSINRTYIQSRTLNGNTFVGLLPNGTSTIARINILNSSDPTNSEGLQLAANSSITMIRAVQSGTGSYNPLTLWTSDTERLRVAVDGNVSIYESLTAANLTFAGGQIQSTNTNQDITLAPNGTGSVISTGPVTLPSYSVSQLSMMTATAGSMVFCNNESGGSVPVFYDGFNWRRATDRAIAS